MGLVRTLCLDRLDSVGTGDGDGVADGDGTSARCPGYPWAWVKRWAALKEPARPPTAPQRGTPVTEQPDGPGGREPRTADHDGHEEDEGHGLRPGRDREAAPECHTERIADRGEERERRPMPQRTSGGDDRRRHGLGGDRAHHPVREVG